MNVENKEERKILGGLHVFYLCNWVVPFAKKRAQRIRGFVEPHDEFRLTLVDKAQFRPKG